MSIFKKKEVEEIEETEIEENEEEKEEMKEKKRKNYLKWGLIGLGTLVGGTIVAINAKRSHDEALEALYFQELNGDDEDSENEDSSEKEETEE